DGAGSPRSPEEQCGAGRSPRRAPLTTCCAVPSPCSLTTDRRASRELEVPFDPPAQQLGMDPLQRDAISSRLGLGSRVGVDIVDLDGLDWHVDTVSAGEYIDNRKNKLLDF